MNNRIQYIIKREELSNLKFAELLGVNPASVSHILAGRNKPSFDFVAKIAEKLPQYNLRWLLTGIGEPIQENNKTNVPRSEQHAVLTGGNENGIPVAIDTSSGVANQPDTIQGELQFESNKTERMLSSAEITTAKLPEPIKERLIICLPDGTFTEYIRK